MTSNQTQIAALPGQVAPAWAVKLLADMKRSKVQTRPVALSTGLRTAAARAKARQQTKGHGSAYGARKFTGAW
jgi:hypothetical protein